jgi:phosphoglycerate dehydrogenase-like enzyme
MDEVGGSAIELLKKAGCEVVYPSSPRPLREKYLIEALQGVDAVLAGTDKYSEKVLSSSAVDSLKIISRWGVGFNEVDVFAATEKGVVVAYTPGMLNDAVADYAFSLLLSSARHVHKGHLEMTQGKWTPTWGNQVSGKTLGIVGCGRIGQAMARRATGFDLRLIGCDVAPHPEAKELGIEFVSMDQLLEQSDFVSLHVALTPESVGLIGKGELSMMKQTAYLVNTARGELIDESALARALKEGWIGGAAIDTFTTEPLPGDHPFFSTPNILLSPHQASRDRGTGEQVSLAAAQAIVDLMQGEKPQFVVDKAVYNSPKFKL